MRTSSPTDLLRRALLAGAVSFAAGLVAGCASPQGAAAARAVLAPTGMLRLAVYPGSPTSLVEETSPEKMRGLTVELGRSLAQRLGVPAQVIVFPRQAEALAALQRGEADFMITNPTPERARLVDFTAVLVDIDLGVLVPPGSPLAAVERMDSEGAIIGVSQGSSSQRVLGERLRHARIRAFATLAAARDALQRGEISGFATNKAILFEQADRLPGARVLDGRWGVEHFAPAVPLGRRAAIGFVDAFAAEARRDGSLQRAADRAGLRGTAAPEAR